MCLFLLSVCALQEKRENGESKLSGKEAEASAFVGLFFFFFFLCCFLNKMLNSAPVHR